MNSGNESPTSLLVKIRGIGHVVSFKNNKVLIGGNPPKLITKPEYRQWMERAVEGIVFQFLYEFPTDEGETRRECWKRLLTFLSGLSDDSVKELPEGRWTVEYVQAGEEGADILVERLP